MTTLVQNLISVVILVVLEFFSVISTEELTWKLIKVWIPVNLIFIGMLVTGMYRYALLDTIYIIRQNFKCVIHSQKWFVWFSWNIVGLTFLFPPFLSVIFQFEVHKCCHGDDIKEHDKYFNSYGGDICFQEGSEQTGLGCLMYDGTSFLLGMPFIFFQALALISLLSWFKSVTTEPTRANADLGVVSLCFSLQIVSAVCGGMTDLSFHLVGYTWQILNCFLTAAYSVSSFCADSVTHMHKDASLVFIQIYMIWPILLWGIWSLQVVLSIRIRL